MNSPRMTTASGVFAAALLTLSVACTTSPSPPSAESPAQGPAATDTDAGNAEAESMRGQGMRGEGMRGQGMRGGRMQGDSARGGGMRGQGMRGEGMRGEGMRGGGMHGEGHGRGQGDAESTPVVVPDELAQGAELFEYICTQCHTVDPPHHLAPPMRHVSRHLREHFSDEASAVDFMLQYIPAPDAELSKMPAMAIDRFGLMPPLPLPESLLREIARYVWFLGEDSESSGHGGGEPRP